MGKWTREELQQAHDHYAAVAAEAARTGDWRAWADQFTEDAEYRYHPWDDPVKGRAAIVEDWLNPGGSADGRDKPGTVEFEYAPYAIDGDRAVIVGWTAYREAPGGEVDRTYDNAWLVEFDGDGRCRSFTEFFMKRR